MYKQGNLIRRDILVYCPELIMREYLFLLGCSVTDDEEILNKPESFTSYRTLSAFNYIVKVDSTYLEGCEQYNFQVTRRETFTAVHVLYETTHLNIILAKIMNLIEELAKERGV